MSIYQHFNNAVWYYRSMKINKMITKLTIVLILVGLISACGAPNKTFLDHLQGEWVLMETSCLSPLDALSVDGSELIADASRYCVTGEKAYLTNLDCSSTEYLTNSSDILELSFEAPVAASTASIESASAVGSSGSHTTAGDVLDGLSRNLRVINDTCNSLYEKQ